MHLLGGCRRTVADFPYGKIVQRDDMNVSLLFRAAYSIYDISNEDGTIRLGGAAFEGMLGLQYRQEIGENSALVFEGGKTMISLPGGAPRVTSSRMEFTLSYRFFL